MCACAPPGGGRLFTNSKRITVIEPAPLYAAAEGVVRAWDYRTLQETREMRCAAGDAGHTDAIMELLNIQSLDFLASALERTATLLSCNLRANHCVGSQAEALLSAWAKAARAPAKLQL